MIGKIQRKTLPLQSNENFLAFDYSNYYDGIVTATDNSLLFYHLYVNHGHPHRWILHMDIGPIKTLKLQESSHPIVAVTKDNCLTLWDFEKRAMPLINVLQFNAPFQDFNWMHNEPHLFTTGFANGAVGIWDLRNAKSPVLNVNVKTSYFRGLKWSPVHNHYLMTNVQEKNLAIFDLRMIRKALSVDKEPDSQQCVKLLEFENKIEDFVWSQQHQWFWTLTEKKCERWKLPNVENIFLEKDDSQDQTLNYGLPDWKVTRILPSFDDKYLLHQNEKNGVYKIICSDLSEQNSLGRNSLGNHVGYCWRNPAYLPPNIEYSFVTLTTQGLAHVTEFATEEIEASEELKFRSTPASLDQYLKQQQRIRKHKLTIGHLKNTVSEETESSLAQDPSQLTSMAHISSGKPAPRSGVIGPVTFMSLLGEDIMAVNTARREGLLDGIRISRIDQLRRQILVELLVPATEIFSIISKNTSGFFNNYYKTDELSSFQRGGITNRSLVLTISFAAKLSQFWTPRFLIENQSSFPFDANVLGKSLMEELNLVAKTHTPKRSSHGRKGGGGLEGMKERLITITTDGMDAFLVQIIRCFRKKALRAWEKKSEKDRIGSSFTSLKHSYETMASLYSESDHDTNNTSSEFLKIIEPKAFRVPFPILSAGMFTPQGELLLFGNATIQAKPGEEVAATSEIVSSLPRNLYQEDSQNHAKGEMGLHHRSYAHLLFTRLKDKLKDGTGRKSITNASSAATLDQSHHGEGEEDLNGRSSSAIGMNIDESTDYELSFTKETRDDESHEDDDNNEYGGGEAEERDEAEKEDYDDLRQSADNEGEGSSGSGKDVLGHLPNERRSSRRDSKSRKSGYPRHNHRDIPLRLGIIDGHPRDRHHYSQYHDLSSLPEGTATAISRGKLVICEVGLHIYQRLAEEYRCIPVQFLKDGSLAASIQLKVEYCRYNAKVVQSLLPNHRKLLQFWQLLAVALDVFAVEDLGSIINWNGSVLGSTLFINLIEFLLKAMDTQLWAITLCLLGDSTAILNLCSSTTAQKKLVVLPKYFGVLNERLSSYLETQVYLYSEWLQIWGFPLLATEIRKHISTRFIASDTPQRLDIPRIGNDELQVLVNCQFCGKQIDQQPTTKALKQTQVFKGNHHFAGEETLSSNRLVRDEIKVTGPFRCFDCRKYGIYCAICTLPARGLCSFCHRCGHGGHEEHLVKWFNGKNTECPTGCGCRCRSELDSFDQELIAFEHETDDDDEDNESGISFSYGDEAVETPSSEVLDGENIHSGGQPSRRPSSGSQRTYFDELFNIDSEYNYNKFDLK